MTAPEAQRAAVGNDCVQRMRVATFANVGFVLRACSRASREAELTSLRPWATAAFGAGDRPLSL